MKEVSTRIAFIASALLTLLNARAADLSFSTVERLANQESRIRLSVPTSTSARINVSTNLIDWTGFMTTGAGSLTITDSFAPYALARFYKAEQLAAGAFTGDNLSSTDGDIVVHPVGHAGFVITWNNIAIYNDPVEGSYTGLPKADLIFIGHEHTDHFNSSVMSSVIKSTAASRIVATQTIYNQLAAPLHAITTPLANGGTTNFFGVSIEAIPAYNSFHPKGTGNGYVITLGGRRIYMSSDTGDIPETRALTNIDVAFLCVNVPYTMTVAQAAAVTRAFRPKVVYPYHFRNQDNTYSDLNSFKTTVGADLGIEVRIRKWY
jgi:L-ascorbate metabolism protein UlaG (beta-lactamase superfamily)